MTFSRPRRRRAGITLVETTTSLAILSLFLALGYATLLVANKNAMVSRLYTLAEEMARDQIDRIETVGPYNPQFVAPLGPQIPAELVLDSARGNNPLVQTLPLYTDPNSGSIVVNATVSTSVADLGNYNARSAAVTVSYTFGKRSYQVRMNTIRASDS